MKQKVAVAATCLSLVLCLAFLLLCAGFARTTLNANALSELARLCRLSVTNLDSAAFDDRGLVQAARGAVDSANIGVTLYAGSGEVLGSTRSGSQSALDEGELQLIADDRATTLTRRGQGAGLDPLFAAQRLPDGRILALSRKGYSMADALAGRMVLLVLIALGVACAILLMIQLAFNRTNRFVGEVQRVLEDFSEGKFDSRIRNVQGDSLQQIAHFNEVMNRVQDRVFRQKTRNQALNTVINHMQNGILAVDEQLRVILVTPAAKHLLNIVGSPEGLPIQQASKDVNLDQVLTEAMRQGGVYTNEVAARMAVGRGHTPLRLYVSPMLKDGEAVGAVALVEDISELRRLERVRTDFAANVSHELKTPLTSIKGFVETLQNGAIENPPMAQKFLRIIMLEADRLTRLINDILSITKLESGKDALPSQRIRLDQMVRDVSDMLSILAAEKQIQIHCNMNDEPSYVVGNPDRVEQMLINLIENAIKYNKNEGLVTVSVFNSEESVNLSVADTGIGISDEDAPRLFERFYRVDKGRSRSMGGTGLGLAIVKHIVRTMNGMIELHSKLGEGTEFLITLPRAVGKPDEDQNPFDDGDEFDGDAFDNE